MSVALGTAIATIAGLISGAIVAALQVWKNYQTAKAAGK